MNIQFTSAESTFCPRLKTREGHDEHISTLHLPISSPPGPSTPLDISHYPIAIRSETATFNPRNIANLWLQLLLIQVQNGNFWNYDDVVKVQGDRAYARTLAAWQAANPNSGPELEAINDLKTGKLDEKTLLFLRHKLQKGLLSRDTAPAAAEMQQMSDFIKKLEDAPDLEATVLKSTKIHKVLIAICKLDTIPADEEFKIRERCQKLIPKWQIILETYKSIEKAEWAEKLAEIQNPAPKLVEPQPVAQEPASEGTEDVDQMPAVCLTQLTPAQCAKIETMAKSCNPPLDRAVVELMCILPQFSAQNEHESYQVAPVGQLLNPVKNLEHKTNPERRFDHWGPKIPPHVLQLTEWVEGHYGIALFVDTKTGEGIVFKEYILSDAEESDPKWEHLVGDRKPIEELLQEWIDKFLMGKFMPSEGVRVHQEGPRRIVNILMGLHKHNALLQEYGWPESFPLPPPQYHDFLKRKNELNKITFFNRPPHRHSLSYKWGSITSKWRFRDNPFVKYDSDIHKYEELNALDNRIRSALDYHERRIEDREYALVADVPLQRDLIQALSLTPSANIGDDWRVDVTPEMIIQRFEEVFTASPEAVDEDTRKMRDVLERAYRRWKLSEQGIYERDWVEGEDDDSTSDYDLESEEIEYEDDEEYEEDEDMEDLDVEVLEADMAADVETIRTGLERYRIGSE